MPLTGSKPLDFSVIQQCMHCGMCLPHCPTYRETGRERNSPRGRIALMRAVSDGDLPGDRAFGEEMSYCLGCLACQTACPAAVNYAELFEHARAEAEKNRALDTPARKFWRWLALDVLFTRPTLLRGAARVIRIAQTTGLDRMAARLRLIPSSLARLMPSAPEIQRKFSDQIIAETELPPTGQPRFRVGVLTGCVQDIAYPQVNRDTADVLLANQCAVITPRRQHCCGSLHAHNGDLDAARVVARKNLDQFAPLSEFDAIITNAGGCGSHLKRYHPLLEDDPDYAEAARIWDTKVKDVHEFLAEIGIRKPEGMLPSAPRRRVAYHESCHLAHGQRVRLQPLDVLRVIPNLDLVPLRDADVCCGSAGIYSITQPEQSAKLLADKVAHILAADPDILATANPGCDLQIARGLREANRPIRVAHPITLLAEAYRRR